MPFTPIHMGPGLLLKSVMQGSFSLMVFGWTQIVMDIQPLFVMLTGEGQVHGFSHTYLGALLLAVPAAVTGKYLAPIGLWVLRIESSPRTTVAWWVAIISACIGSFSHVLFDSVMHVDMQPFFPMSAANGLLWIVSISTLHQLCLVSGVVGTGVYFLVRWRSRPN